MSYDINRTPRWLARAQRHLGWLGVPNIAILFVTLQALGFLMLSSNPLWMERLALVPDRVREGEVWRLVTFLAMPVSMNLLWVFFALWFLYFILSSIESLWGDFQTTLYVLVSILLTIAFSMTFNYPITDVSDFQSSLFLAAAGLFPENEILLFLVMPVKLKWLGWLSMGFVTYRFFTYGWMGKLYLVAIYSNYLLFFGPALISRVRQELRRREYRRKSRM